MSATNLLTKFPWVKNCTGSEGHVSWTRGFGASNGYTRVNKYTIYHLFTKYDIEVEIISISRPEDNWFGEQFKLSLKDYEKFKTIQENLCKHDWEVNRGIGPDHTTRECSKCGEIDGFA